MANTSPDYGNQLCEVVEYIVDDAVANASYDRTVQATVLKAVDKTIGKYSVKYQDSIFYAYAIDVNVTYSEGTDVYILIPGNDTSRDKAILGSTKKLGINYTNNPEGDEAYEVIGNNCIKDPLEYGLCSYQSKNFIHVVYDRDKYINEIKLDTFGVENYIKKASSIICGAKIKTNLPREQQLRGNYGIVFDLDFLDNATGETITKNYVIDVNQMRGNPYKIPVFTRQYGIFDIDGINFQSVKRIYLFVNNFPNIKENMPNDIFIKELELSAAENLTAAELASSALTFITPQGIYFDDNDLDSATLKIQAQVRVKGKVVDKNSQDLTYYWFKENMAITSDSKFYNKYGGQGWECLNNFNIIAEATNTEPAIIEWIPEDYEWEIIKKENIAKENHYKCAVLYGDNLLSKEFVIVNYSSEYDITIESNKGTQFYYDIGNPTLTCKVNGAEKAEDNFKYVWGVQKYDGTFESLVPTETQNTHYNNVLQSYNNLLKDIENGIQLPEASQKKIEEYETILAAYEKIMRVETNKIFNLSVNTITNFSTYKCSVYYNDTFLGTGSITILNSLEANNVYSLIINEGNQVFKYNEAGISPTSKSLDFTYVIPSLTFTIYDNMGQPLEEEILKKCDIQWIVPIEDTLLVLSEEYDKEENSLGETVIKQQLILSYNIAERYNINKTNNNIQLIVKYKDMILRARTNFTFVKEGEPGTNGTDFICRIIPNNIDSEVAPLYPTLINGILNYTPKESEKWFKVQLWENGENIFTGTESNDSQGVKVTWSILRNNYGLGVTEDSSFEIVDASKGRFKYLGFREDSPANIIKCEVIYKENSYYATLPLITVETDEGYFINLKDNTGFRYVLYTTDGRRPQYDNSYPFELRVIQNISGYEEDISEMTNQYQVAYDYDLLGRHYSKDDDGNIIWIKDSYLESDSFLNSLKVNQIALKPRDTYNGQNISNGILCKVSQLGIEIGKIHIPVHFLLNRYGNAALNDWDGNHIEINQDGGFILAPQIGAGVKNKADNTFTGMFMGQVQEAGKYEIETGLFGYSSGIRSMFLNAEDGSVILGKQGYGQIILDPSAEQAMIYSNNFWADYDQYGKPLSYESTNEQSAGLLINLTKPEIRYGNGKFSVDENGFLTATEAKIVGNITAEEGFIGDWEIKDGELKNSTGSIVINPTTGIKVGDGFSVTPDGHIQLTGTISWGDNDIGASKVYALYARTKLSKPTKTYNEYNDSSSTTWHKVLDSANDLYASYSYDNGNTWEDVLKIQGEDGENGEGADLPSYIKSTHISSTTIASPYVCGGKIYATGNGKKDEAAFYIYDSGSVNSSGTLKLGNKMGYISYDTDGSGSNEAAERIIFEALSDNALKIQTNNGDISIAAGGTGNYVYFGSKVSFGGEIIVTTDKYVTSVSNLGSGTLGQIKFVIES